MAHVDPIRRLILAFSRLPSVGEKTAARFTFYLLNRDRQYTADLAEALSALHSEVQFCSVCAHLSAIDPCPICTNPHRDPTLICVVEDVSALMAIEKTGEYRGMYHVLHGVIDPPAGVGPEDLKIAALLRRLQGGGSAHIHQEALTSTESVEVILATNPSIDGEATALYLQRLLKPLGVKLSRIASGIPIGTHLQYADQLSLAQALISRRHLL
jgi:recombination protein RecR